MPDSHEIPLTGGNVTRGLVRLGDTVRRPATPHRANIRALLNRFEHLGIKQTPRHLGIDSRNRDILTFLPGTSDWPADMWTSDQLLTEATRLLRRLHDASAALVASHPTGWAYAHPDPSACEVIGHSDFAPYNMLFQNGHLTGVIDWDLAGPAPRLRDLAYLAYWLVPLSFTSGEMTAASMQDKANGSPRLTLISSLYLTTPHMLLPVVGQALAHMASPDAARPMIGEAATQRLAKGGHFAHWQAEHTAFRQTFWP